MTAPVKAIKLSNSQWYNICKELHTAYPKSVLALRSRMRNVLGFTSRNHREFIFDRGYVDSVYLDFYSEHKRTMFLLKYAEFINRENYEN